MRKCCANGKNPWNEREKLFEKTAETSLFTGNGYGRMGFAGDAGIRGFPGELKPEGHGWI